jgi:hypothetical protein
MDGEVWALRAVNSIRSAGVLFLFSSHRLTAHEGTRHRSVPVFERHDACTKCISLSECQRLDPSWLVLASPSTPAVDRCVDVFVRPDGTFGFETFRRDREDMGAWTPIAYHSIGQFGTEADALAAARDAVSSLPPVLNRAT